MIYKDFCVALATNKCRQVKFVNFDIRFSERIDMTQKKFVFRQLSRYICTRRIQFILQNFHVVSFSDNDDVVCCFVGRGKDIFAM